MMFERKIINLRAVWVRRGLLVLFEIGILKDVRRGSDEPEADAVETCIAAWESVPADENDIVRAPVRVVVDDFVYSGFADRVSWTEERAVSGGSFVTWAVAAFRGIDSKLRMRRLCGS